MEGARQTITALPPNRQLKWLYELVTATLKVADVAVDCV